MNAAALTLPMEPIRDNTRAGSRALQFALLMSALIHAAALGWLPGLERIAERAPLPLRILLPAPPASPAPASVAVSQAPTPAARSEHRTAQAPTQRVIPVLAEPTIQARSEEPVPATAMPAAPPAPAAPVVAAPAAALAPAPAAPDPQVLAGYGRSVAGALAAHQRYPRVAQLRQWQGTTLLQLEFAADGRLIESRVLNSSGHDVLDRQALEMLRAAQPLPAPPTALAGRPLVVNVPVVFRLAG